MENSTHKKSQNLDFIDSFDFGRFKTVFKSSKLWLGIIILLPILLMYLNIRYTKPIYKSSSTLQLDIKSDASVLGFGDLPDRKGIDAIASEIEIITSPLFLATVAKESNLDISYHIYGRYLTNELYDNSPFIVSYKIISPHYYNVSFDVEIIDDKNFILKYDKTEEKKLSFGEEFFTPAFNFLIEKTSAFGARGGDKFYFTVNSNEKIIEYLNKGLDVMVENVSAKTINVSFEGLNRSKVQDLVSRIDSLFFTYTHKIKNQTIDQKINFLKQQMKQIQEKLLGYQSYFEDFTIENRTTNLPQDLDNTLSMLVKYDSQRLLLQKKVNKLAIYHELVIKSKPIILDPISIQDIEEPLLSTLKKYSEIQEERELKSVNYNESSHLMQQMNLKFKTMSENLKQILMLYEENLNSQIKVIKGRVIFFEEQLSKLPSMGTEHSEKSRMYSMENQFLIMLYQRKIELEITKAGIVNNNIILSPASLPTMPISPNKTQWYFFSIVISIFLSLTFLLIRYLRHNKILGLSDINKITDTPVLGIIPKVELNNSEASVLLIRENTKSSLSEALRALRTNLEFIENNEGKKTKFISVTSSISGEGKTFMSVNLGGVLSLTNKKVCVIDFDMRKPKVHLAFGHDNNSSHGISTLLSKKSTLKEALKTTSLENLYYIPVGDLPPNPSELLVRGDLKKIKEELSKEFEVVIFDTPPVGLVTDAQIIMPQSDVNLYILRWNFTKRSVLKFLDSFKEQNRVNNFSVILNCIDFSKSQYGVLGNYGYGGGYGDHDYYIDDNDK